MPYDKRGTVRGRNNEMLNLIEKKAGLTNAIVECGGDFACTGSKSAREQAIQAISELVKKGYTLLSLTDPCEKTIMVQAGSHLFLNQK